MMLTNSDTGTWWIDGGEYVLYDHQYYIMEGNYPSTDKYIDTSQNSTKVPRYRHHRGGTSYTYITMLHCTIWYCNSNMGSKFMWMISSSEFSGSLTSCWFTPVTDSAEVTAAESGDFSSFPVNLVSDTSKVGVWNECNNGNAPTNTMSPQPV